MKKKLLLIFNPKSGVQKFSQYFFEVVDKFTAAGFLVTTYPTQSPGEAGEMIAHHAGEYDYLVCSGGDGTISQAITALLALEKRPAFGIIPSGTVNDFAVSLGIPRDVLLAADIITTATPRPLDIGRFGSKHFSYVAAFGIFTDVSYSTPQNTKNLLGKLAYFLEGIKRFGSAKPAHCEVLLDDEPVSGEFVLGIIANTHSIAGIKLHTEMGVRMDDGLFEVILVKEPHTLKDRQEIISSLLAQEIKTSLLTIRKAKKITVTASTAIAWTLDGDFGGEYAQITIENLHHAMELLMPSYSVFS
ncbi:MAG: YegS/Rv2252/BmrU family lipid kinase [Defluviitaleaceae bacterium]|nr:YegS/Rv2252/BmrU family lipid kinase [Defluviitaleaceae bacterium]